MHGLEQRHSPTSPGSSSAVPASLRRAAESLPSPASRVTCQKITTPHPTV
ncbi:hypothetical protein C791_2880 [Amycolatopsis azurea DSM 43854]|uniref:Uncharacterized protein n=1 Tax=Amycolatopsis azurea DSM 43854 TaxID=1238180 RepID=M2NVW8_9PSEU|nr:hypothetical protein C791_2880 [Amycolatopsis azurea DSM 43854]